MRKTTYYRLGLLFALLTTISCDKDFPLTDPSTESQKMPAGSTKRMGLQASAVPGGYTLVYADEFNNNTLSPSAWYYRESNYYAGGYSKRENVSVVTQDGIGYLDIAFRDDRDWNNDGVNDISSGGTITSKAFGYGYYEARIKFFKGTTGLHESFCTHGLGFFTGQTLGTEYKEAAKKDLVPTDNQMLEIDAIELDAAQNHGKTNFWMAYVDESTSGAFNRYDESYMDLDQWINVGFEWLPNTIIYYIDGVERFRYTHQTPAYHATEVWLSALANNKWSTPGHPEPGASMKVDYFRYYNKPIAANLIGNTSFEFGAKASTHVTSWTVYDNIYDNATTDGAEVVYDGTAYHGNGYLKMSAKSSVPILTTKQLLSYIPNGTYRLSAWVKKTSGLTSARMRVLDTGAPDRYVNIPTTAQWTRIILDNVVVTDNKAVVGFSITGSDGETLKIDKVELYNKQFPLPDDLGVLVEDMGPGYLESGTWLNSNLTGYRGTKTRYSGTTGAYAQWQPTIPTTGNYDVFIYKVVHASADPNAKIVIKHSGGTTTKYVNYTTGTSGWVSLGTYNFTAGTTGNVRNYRNTNATNIRADAVYFAIPGSVPPL